jgi:hypothetical protein
VRLAGILLSLSPKGRPWFNGVAMKSIAFVLLLGCGGAAVAQAPSPAPPSMPNPDKLFQLPPAFDGKPKFTLQVPDGKNPLLGLPQVVINPPRQELDSHIDPGMIRKPHGFVQQPSRPAQTSKLYPDLKVLPIEIASLGPDLSASPNLKGEPIPLVWPKAKVEPIPITWEGYTMTPIGASSSTAITPKR